MNYLKPRKVQTGDGTTVALACVGALLLIPIFAAIRAVIILLVWNLGVVNIVASCGGHVGSIGFWTAFWIGLGLGLISSVFKSTRSSD